MASGMLQITVEPGSRILEVVAGTVFSKALEDAGIDFAYPCARARICGQCRVIFEAGAPEPTAEENRLLSYGDIESGIRLACCTILTTDATVRLPGAANLQTEHILRTGVRSDVVIDPDVKKFCGQLPPSTLEAPLSDWTRVIRSLPEQMRSDARPALPVLQKLPSVVACAEENDHPVTVTLRGNRVIEVQCGDHSHAQYGVAVDLGTTTIAVMLVDMLTGAEVAFAGGLNPQRAFGHDLISRIHAVQSDPENLNVLHHKVIETIGDLIRQACVEKDVDPRSVCAMSLAGNTVMSHLFLRIDPSSLGQAPFAGTLRAGVRLDAEDLNLPIHPDAPVYVLPCMGGFIGGDIVAGILMTKLEKQAGVNVLIDIGTNGEVVVSSGGELFATSSAAGPSFEGGKIACGMIAMDGAIDTVRFNGDDFHVSTLGNRPARGICGSGLFEALARGVETGMIALNGRITSPDAADHLPPALAKRLRRDGQNDLRIQLTAPHAGLGEIFLSQKDVREFQLGKGAVQTAVLMAIDAVGIPLEQIDRLLVGGAFGNHLNVDDAIAVGLLPDLPREKIFFIGNSSLEGARCVLLNQYERRRAEQIAEKARFVELASRPEFQERFALSMMLSPPMF
ncbi:DUF4445 domain-containing protein [bacterium]|nr:DUF4445 domain-containing protein [bacterium]